MRHTHTHTHTHRERETETESETETETETGALEKIARWLRALTDLLEHLFNSEHPNGSLEPFLTPHTGNLIPSSYFGGHQASTWCTDIHADKKLIKPNRNKSLFYFLKVI